MPSASHRPGAMTPRRAISAGKSSSTANRPLTGTTLVQQIARSDASRGSARSSSPDMFARWSMPNDHPDADGDTEHFRDDEPMATEAGELGETAPDVLQQPAEPIAHRHDHRRRGDERDHTDRCHRAPRHLRRDIARVQAPHDMDRDDRTRRDCAREEPAAAAPQRNHDDEEPSGDDEPRQRLVVETVTLEHFGDLLVKRRRDPSGGAAREMPVRRERIQPHRTQRRGSESGTDNRTTRAHAERRPDG